MSSFSSRLGYIDGFAGPGRYADGEPGSPIIALKAAIEHRATIRSELAYLFIEKDAVRKAELEAEVAQLVLPSNVQVHIRQGQFDDTMARELDDVQGNRLIPIFAFVDPFGWSQTPYTLIKRILATSPKAEVLINFMYEEVNRFLSVEEHAPKWSKLFGTSEWRAVNDISGAAARRTAIHDLYKRQLISAGAKHVWSFEMRNRRQTTDYFLFFATNSITGLSKMKEVMWSVDRSGGFVFADPRSGGVELELDFKPNYSLLRRLVLERFGGCEVSVEQVERYVVEETAFLATHYKTAVLAQLETATPPVLIVVKAKDGRRRRTFPPGTIIRFLTPQSEIAIDAANPVVQEVPVVAKRFKSGGRVHLRSRPGLEADVRDQGHGRGFVIRILQAGTTQPILTLRTGAGVKWKEALTEAGARLTGFRGGYTS